MIIGVSREIMDQEFRVALTPEGVKALVGAGHQVLVERGAGAGSGFLDRGYREAGAKIVGSHAAVFKKAEMIVKVKQPLLSEYTLLQRGQILFTFLHLATNRRLIDVLVRREVKAVAYETIEREDGFLPILKPMSEIAGRMSVLIGAFYLQKTFGGSGILISGIPEVEGAKVVILGAGTAGSNALQMAVGLGARVIVLDRDEKRVRQLRGVYGEHVIGLVATQENIEAAILDADLSIGAVLLSGSRAPRLVSRKIVSRMKKGSVIVDISVDQGGCFETSRPTTHSHPVYEVKGVLHYCVANIPSVVPRTATLALTNATLPFMIEIANRGLEKAKAANPALAKGINIYDGKIVHPKVALALRM
ncbi:MAG TPA: alanine dehydrogenase [Nitrospiria bacterium]|nr:alanine dehydrogenase [Nitrospiria bacterium]